MGEARRRGTRRERRDNPQGRPSRWLRVLRTVKLAPPEKNTPRIPKRIRAKANRLLQTPVRAHQTRLRAHRVDEGAAMKQITTLQEAWNNGLACAFMAVISSDCLIEAALLTEATFYFWKEVLDAIAELKDALGIHP